MSFEVTQGFVQEYQDNVIMLSQQKMSRLRSCVRVQADIKGQNYYFERIGPTAAVQRTTRHGDTPLASTPQSRRQLTLYDWEWADLVDEQDKLRMIISPESYYLRAFAMAFGRAFDDVIISSFYANAQAGQDGATAVVFPYATQAIGSSYNSGNDGGHLSIPKLLRAQQVLNLADVDPDEERFAVVSPKQITDLLETTQVTSSDYNTVQALVEGKINTFDGFKFIQSNRLPTWGASQTGFYGSSTSASGDRRCFFYARNGVGLGIAEDITTRMTERADKAYSTQVYMRMTIGGTRIEDVKVVEVDCTES